MKKILIAEDDKFLARAYQVKFAKAGFDVQVATDGEETLTILKTFQPDVILLDLIMPKKDGFVILAELKKNEQYKNIPVIIASNLGQPGDMEKAKSLGAVDYFIKSDFSLKKIIEKINDLTKNS
jgi:CheY-like chemotaxis protein